VSELINSNVDVIVAWATPTVIVVRRATSIIPIVMVSVGDPVGSGFIASLARPGGNITGVSNITADLSAKLMELFVELVPGMKRVGVVRNPNNPNVTVQLHETEDAVLKLNMQVQVVDAQTSDEFERALAQLSAGSVDGVVLLADSTVIEHSRRIAELAQSARLPTAFQRRENVDAGGLLSYGANVNEQFRQAAFYVGRILKGAMAQFAYTSEAWTAFTKHPEDRTSVVQALAQKLGCRFEALYYSLGEYDGFVILEAPDEATVTAFLLAAMAPGHLRSTKTTVLMRAGAVVEAMKKAGGVKYSGPKK
jgi:uncharacterized protein with GYD domain